MRWAVPRASWQTSRMPDVIDHPERDDSWNESARDETPTERLDRNWSDLLQELRVVQTGVQLLTGFLLTLPFQQRFAGLTAFQQDIYLATVSASIAATGFLIAPVTLHRALFRQHARRLTVAAAHRLAIIGTAWLGVAVVGVVFLVFDVLTGRSESTTAAAVAAALLLGLWCAFPWAMRSRQISADRDRSR